MRLRRLFRRRPLKESLKIVDARVGIYRESNRKGRVSVSLIAVNFWRKALTVHDVYVDWLKIGSSTIDSPGVRFSGEHAKVPARSTVYIYFEVPLSDSDGPRLYTMVGPSQNALSSPRATLDLRGNATVGRGQRREKVAYDCRGVTPEVMLSTQGVETGDV